MAASRLWYDASLPDYEYERLREIFDWFNENLEKPRRFSRSRRRNGKYRAVCWFKSSAKRHLEKIRELIALLENNEVMVRMIKAEKVGYVVYEDEFQIVAEPFADMNLK